MTEYRREYGKPETWPRYTEWEDVPDTSWIVYETPESGGGWGFAIAAVAVFLALMAAMFLAGMGVQCGGVW